MKRPDKVEAGYRTRLGGDIRIEAPVRWVTDSIGFGTPKTPEVGRSVLVIVAYDDERGATMLPCLTRESEAFGKVILSLAREVSALRKAEVS